MKRLALSVVFALQVTGAAAADHLEPYLSSFAHGSVVVDILEDYDRMVISAFQDAFEPTVRARVIAIPSFQPERASGVREREGKYTIFSLNPQVHLWTYATIDSLAKGVGNDEMIARLKAGVPPNWRDVTIEHCEIEITQQLGLRIIGIWRSMLLQTRYPDNPIQGLDGATFHFSMNTIDNPGRVRQILAGQTWTPSPSSKPGMLVSVTYSMDNYCRTKNRTALAELERQVNVLHARLGQ